MSEFRYIPKQKYDIFEYRQHRNIDAKHFIRFMLSKGLISAKEVYMAIDESLDETAQDVADVILEK